MISAPTRACIEYVRASLPWYSPVNCRACTSSTVGSMGMLRGGEGGRGGATRVGGEEDEVAGVVALPLGKSLVKMAAPGCFLRKAASTFFHFGPLHGVPRLLRLRSWSRPNLL